VENQRTDRRVEPLQTTPQKKTNKKKKKKKKGLLGGWIKMRGVSMGSRVGVRTRDCSYNDGRAYTPKRVPGKGVIAEKRN